MKKFMKLTVVMVLVLTLGACGTTNKGKTVEEPTIGVQMPNPFVSCETIEQAKEHVDFEIKTPNNMPEGYELMGISTIENELVEFNYQKGESKITYRQGIKSETISGDYSVYEEINTEEVDDKDITFSGNEGKINLATWSDDNYSYSLNINIGNTGLEQIVVIDFIKGIN